MIAGIASAEPAPEADSDGDREDVLSKLVDDTPDTDAAKPDYLFRLGRLYEARYRESGQKQAFLKAVKVFKTVADNDAFRSYPKMDVALFEYGATLQSGKYMKEARAVYDRLLKYYPESPYVPEVHLAFGDYFFDAGQMADAEARYKVVLRFPKAHAYWYATYKLGLIQMNAGDNKKAKDSFTRVADATKKDKTARQLYNDAVEMLAQLKASK